MTSALEFTIRSFSPDSLVLPSASAERSQREAAPWVTRITAPGIQSFVISLEAPAGAAHLLDGVSVPAIAADLMRAGWVEVARPHVRPIITDDTIYRGFSLERYSTLFPEVPGNWRLECLMPADLRMDFDWPLMIRTLDAYHRSVFFPEMN